MTDHSGSTTWCYNRFGQMTRKVQRTQGKTFALHGATPRTDDCRRLPPTPTAAWWIISTTVRAGWWRSASTSERAARRQQLLRSASYHPFGPVAQWTYGNGRVMNRTMNKSGQPGIVQDTAAGGISIGYEFDEVGNLKMLRNGNQTDPPKRSLRHDGLNRLTSANDGANVCRAATATTRPATGRPRGGG